MAFFSKEFERFTQGAEFAKAVPTQVVFFHQLLHVLWCRTASAGFEQAAALHQRYDRQHLGRGAQFQNWEQVGQIVAQHVAGDGHDVAAFAHVFQRETGRFAWGKDRNVQTCLFQCRFNIFDQLGVVCAVCVQPERRSAGGLVTADAQFDPVSDRRSLNGGRTPDVAGFNAVFGQNIAVVQNDADGACAWHFKGGWVAAVFFGFLSHQTTVRHSPAGGHVQLAGFFEVVDGFVINGRIAVVRDAAFGVSRFAIWAPADAASLDHSRHRGVDDDVRWHVQVGDAFVAIDHVQRRTGVQCGL